MTQELVQEPQTLQHVQSPDVQQTPQMEADVWLWGISDLKCTTGPLVNYSNTPNSTFFTGCSSYSSIHHKTFKVTCTKKRDTFFLLSLFQTRVAWVLPELDSRFLLSGQMVEILHYVCVSENVILIKWLQIKAQLVLELINWMFLNVDHWVKCVHMTYLS